MLYSPPHGLDARTHTSWPMSRRTDDRLTKRQTEVARLAARSLSDREIAKELGLSPHTVHTHLRNIFARLDISSREELTEILDYERD